MRDIAVLHVHGSATASSRAESPSSTGRIGGRLSDETGFSSGLSRSFLFGLFGERRSESEKVDGDVNPRDGSGGVAASDSFGDDLSPERRRFIILPVREGDVFIVADVGDWGGTS